MANSGTKFDVAKFDGKHNFGLWQVKVRALLIKEGLHRILLGKASKDVEVSDRVWEDMELKALSTIQLCLHDDVLYGVLSETTASGIWAKLESTYMTKSLPNRIYLKQQLYKFSMKEGSSLHDHLNSFNKLLSECLSMDIQVEEEDKAVILLNSLPKAYESMVTTLTYSKDVLDLEEVTAALLSDDIRKKSSSSRVYGDSVLYSRGHSGPNGGGKSKFKGSSDSYCKYCKKKGHVIKDCWKLQNKEKGKNSGDDKGKFDTSLVFEDLEDNII